MIEVKAGDDAEIRDGKAVGGSTKSVKVDKVTERFIFAGGKRFDRSTMKSGSCRISIVTEAEKRRRRERDLRDKIRPLLDKAHEERLAAALAALEGA